MKNFAYTLVLLFIIGFHSLSFGADNKSNVVSTVSSLFAQLNVSSNKLRFMTEEERSRMSPQDALDHLKAGNKRFISGKMLHRNFPEKVNATAFGQFPFAAIVNCIDSRSPTELVFDQGIGDIFAIRVAGNIQNPDVLGSLEFATQVSGAKLIAVIGHTKCGAIKGACEDVKLGNLTQLLHKIQPAIQQAYRALWNKDCNDEEFLNYAAKQNVLLVMEQIQKNSSVIRNLLSEGKVGLVGGLHDLSTGRVTFFDDYQVIKDAT